MYQRKRMATLKVLSFNLSSHVSYDVTISSKSNGQHKICSYLHYCIETYSSRNEFNFHFIKHEGAAAQH